MAEVKFQDVKEDILRVLRTRNMQFAGEKQLKLVDGFVYLPVQMTMGSIHIGGESTIPAVILLGANTGRLYFVALKHLLPHIEDADAGQ
jgi:hypothetical protein